MANLHKLISIALFHFVFGLMNISLSAQNSYQLKFSSVDRDTVYLKKELGLETVFTSRILCVEFVNKLPGLLQTKGYVTASIDKVRFDSLSATVELYLGLKYRWAEIITSKADETLLLEAGWRSSSFRDRQMDFKQFQLFQERILNDLENKGHPFAKVFLDSIVLKEDAITARLQVQKGPLYKIDSIRVYGDLKISNFFLQRYLDISNNSIYNKEKLQRIGKKISELSFAEEERPSNLSLLGTGSVLNLYLKQKRSSQINVLLGFLPNNDQLTTKKLLVTGEANIHLRNSLGAGESLGLNWQQIQVNSPRLNIYYRQPYILNSNFGIDFNFDMFRKDTTFLNVNLQLGTQYMLQPINRVSFSFSDFRPL
jgi:outer membrane protein assembly factor BamA